MGGRVTCAAWPGVCRHEPTPTKLMQPHLTPGPGPPTSHPGPPSSFRSDCSALWASSHAGCLGTSLKRADTMLWFSVSQAKLASGPFPQVPCASWLRPSWPHGQPCSSGLSKSPVLSDLPSGAVLVGLALGALKGSGKREPPWPQAHPTGTRPHLEEATWQLHMQLYLPVNSEASCQGLTCFTEHFLTLDVHTSFSLP